MLSSVQPGWDRAVRSSHGKKVREGCENQPTNFESHPASTDAISTGRCLLLFWREAYLGLGFQSPHLVAILRLEGWLEEIPKVEGQGHSRSEEIKV